MSREQRPEAASKAHWSSFFYVARGSLSELDTQLEICLRVGHLEKAVYHRFASKLEEISKMLNGLMLSLRNKS
jgi:four helix bundle protein